MQLPLPCAPFSRIEPQGNSISIDTSGKILVLPTGDSTKLPSFDEYTNSNRLSVAESPFGGLKGSGATDYAVGTVYCQTSNVSLTDTSGNNAAQTLSAGKLKELSLLTVNTTSHTITEEFILSNTATSYNSTAIDPCDSLTGWTSAFGANTSLSLDTGIKISGDTDASRYLAVGKTVSTSVSGKDFIVVEITPSFSGELFFKMVLGVGYVGAGVACTANTKTKYVIPFRAPVGVAGILRHDAGVTYTTITEVQIGARAGTVLTGQTVIVHSISLDSAKPSCFEIQVPDVLADSSAEIYTHNGSAYQLCRTCKLNSTFEDVSSTDANCTYADGTKLSDVFGASGLGRSVFPKGNLGDTKSGSLADSTITYSTNKGTQKRIGFRVDLGPYVAGTPNLSKCRIKVVIYYSSDSNGKYTSSYEFADSTNSSYGLQNLSKPWICIYDSTKTEIDYFLFTHRPKNLIRKKDETGTIHELQLFPGNGAIYYGKITHFDLTLDSNSNLIPDCLEVAVEGSLTKFLECYGMVIS